MGVNGLILLILLLLLLLLFSLDRGFQQVLFIIIIIYLFIDHIQRHFLITYRILTSIITIVATLDS